MLHYKTGNISNLISESVWFIMAILLYSLHCFNCFCLLPVVINKCKLLQFHCPLWWMLRLMTAWHAING